MLALRRDETDLKTGKIAFLNLPDPVLGYTRGTEITCLFNLSPEPVTLDLPNDLTPLLSQGATISADGAAFAANGFVIARGSAA